MVTLIIVKLVFVLLFLFAQGGTAVVADPVLILWLNGTQKTQLTRR